MIVRHEFYAGFKAIQRLRCCLFRGKRANVVEKEEQHARYFIIDPQVLNEAVGLSKVLVIASLVSSYPHSVRCKRSNRIVQSLVDILYFTRP
jgi:hypothetical protein